MGEKFQTAAKAVCAVADILAFPARRFLYDTKELCKAVKQDTFLEKVYSAAAPVMGELAGPLSFPLTLGVMGLLQGRSPPTSEVIMIAAVDYAVTGAVGFLADAINAFDSGFEPFLLSKKYAQKLQQQTPQPS